MGRTPMVSEARLHSLICAVIMAIGATDMAGWIMKSRTMVTFAVGGQMVFDTGLCFVLCGAALWVRRDGSKSARWARIGLVGTALVMASTMVVEHVLDVSLIDLSSLHSWYDYGNTRPGRMAPNTALGFLIIGCAVLLMERVASKKQALTAMVLTFCGLAVGLTGLAGYVLTPDLLFDWASSARMAISTSTGMILCSLALRLSWSQERWYVTHQFLGEDEKIRLVGPATLVVVTIAATLSGFVLQQSSFETALLDKLQTSRENRTASFGEAVSLVTGITLTESRRARLVDAGSAMLLATGWQQSAAARTAIAAELSAAQFLGVRVENVDRGVAGAVGVSSAAPVIAAALKKDDSLELLWDEKAKLVLRSSLPLAQDGRRIGTMIIDQSADSLIPMLSEAGDLGNTAEVTACVADGAKLMCFPGNRHTEPFSVSPVSGSGPRLPMQMALSGRSGSVLAVDYRGHNVFASYGLLAPGLGFVVKQDAGELFAAIRRGVQWGAALVFIISVLGAMFLYFQLKPLAEQMRAGETLAKERELQMRAVLEAVDEGILTFDKHDIIREVNPALCEIFSYDAQELMGKDAALLLMPGASGETTTPILEPSWRGLAGLAGRRNLKLPGRRKDGSQIPLEMTIKATASLASLGSSTYVCVVRDITERIDAERKLTALGMYDSLTALPNRSLFLEKLTSAASRMDRSGASIALLFIDVDDFKEVNDNLGHRAGDDLLIQFSQRLAGLVRDTDTVARLAGDEFTILLEGLKDPVNGAQRIADKLIASLRKPFVLSGRETIITASVGVVMQEHSDFNVADLLARADAAMYTAKRAGKNRVIAA